MSKRIFLTEIRPLFPRFQERQEQLVDWMLKAHQQAALLVGEDFHLNQAKAYCVSPEIISRRFYECPDTDESWESHQIYDLSSSLPGGVESEQRHLFFQKRSMEIFHELYKDRELPGHLIHVTCTGYTSPSGPQLFMEKMNKSVPLTHAYHMGCYASLPALRVAQALSLAQEVQVDIAHTEMCSLHMNPLIHTPEQLIVQSLFADGHIAYRLGSNFKGRAFEVDEILEKLVPESTEDMTWVPGKLGMRMSLSRDVPAKIRKWLPEFLHDFCQKAGVSWDELRVRALFAIHPGGPKIIQGAQRILDLTDEQVKYSLRVLHERGNMSSSTLPHVWHEILQDLSVPEGTPVVSLAFGPGLTIFGSLFYVVSR